MSRPEIEHANDAPQSLNLAGEPSHRYVQGAGDGLDRGQVHPAPLLRAANGIAMHPTALGEIFLRDAPVPPQSPQSAEAVRPSRPTHASTTAASDPNRSTASSSHTI